MKRFAQQFKKQSDTVRLRAAERRDLKDRLVAYMEYHPLPKTMAVEKKTERISSESFTVFSFNTFEFRSLLGTFAVLTLIIVPIVAERTVPGDVLYPVKVNFNEEVRATLTVSPYAKLEWETERLNRRIAEARLLASEGKLTEEVEAGVAAAVKQHSDAAQEEIASLRESDQDEAAIAEIAFESALVVQAEVLEKELAKEVEAKEAGEEVIPGRSVAILASAIADAKETASQNQSGMTPSYEKLSFKIEQETTRAYELFESIKEAASEEEVSDIERRLGDIERKIADATALHASSTEEVATADVPEGEPVPVKAEVALLRTALSDLQKLIRFMTDIDVRASVTVDELVPVTLTPAESEAKLQTILADVNTRLAVVETALAADPENENSEKISAGSAEVANLASSSAAALATKEYDKAERDLTIAGEYLDDLEGLAAPKAPVESEPEAPQEETASSTDETASSIEPVAEVESASTSIQRASSTDTVAEDDTAA